MKIIKLLLMPMEMSILIKWDTCLFYFPGGFTMKFIAGRIIFSSECSILLQFVLTLYFNCFVIYWKSFEKFYKK